MNDQEKHSALQSYQVNGQSNDLQVNGHNGGVMKEPPDYESGDEDRITQTMENVNLR